MSQAAFAEAVPIIELRQSIESRVSAISPFVDRLMCFPSPLFRYFRKDEEDQFRLEIAVREAVANAVIHGDGQDPGKRVHIACCCTLGGELLLSVGDEGAGFGYDTNRITIIDKNNNIDKFELKTKGEVAVDILDRVASLKK